MKLSVYIPDQLYLEMRAAYPYEDNISQIIQKCIIRAITPKQRDLIVTGRERN